MVSFGPYMYCLGFPLIKRQSRMHIVKLNPCAFFTSGQVQNALNRKYGPFCLQQRRPIFLQIFSYSVEF